MTLSSSSSNPNNFFTKLETRIAAVDSHLCVGLDPHWNELFPAPGPDTSNNSHSSSHDHDLTEQEVAQAAYTFCKDIIDATAEHTACYKPNAAFFEAIGPIHGMQTLQRVIQSIPSDIPILLDVKRGDIGSTAQAYAKASYDLGVHAVTLSPLMGWDSIAPFLSEPYDDKGVFVLCKTSNPGSNDFMTLQVSNHSSSGTSTSTSAGEMSPITLYEQIAHQAREWSPLIGLVVGATDSDALRKARQAAGQDVWILAPGVGAQGGDLEQSLLAGLNHKGTKMLIPVSRGISQASDKNKAAKDLKDSINEARMKVMNQIEQEHHKRLKTENTCNDDSEVAPYQKEFLEFSLQQGVLKFGSFVLKSGRISPYFFNAGLFASGASLWKLGKAYAASIYHNRQLTDENGKVKFDVIFGPAYKGISLGAVVCAALYNDYGIDVDFAYDRKEAKDHGEGGKLVGASMEQKRVLIVDDVITAGTAIRQSYDMLISVGATPVAVSIALDRAEKRSLDDPVSAVQAVARDLAIPVVSIVSLPQLQGFLRNNKDYGNDILELVTNYRAQYGV